MKEESAQQYNQAAGAKILSEEKISDNRVVLTVSSKGKEMKMPLVKIGDEWKVVK